MEEAFNLLGQGVKERLRNYIVDGYGDAMDNAEVLAIQAALEDGDPDPEANYYPYLAKASKTPFRKLLYVASQKLWSLAGIIIAARNINVKWDYGTSYLLVAILIAVMAGVRPEGGYGRVVNVMFSAIVLQLLSSLLNFIGLSNFVRDLAWGVLLLCFLAVGRFDLINKIMAFVYSKRNPQALD